MNESDCDKRPELERAAVCGLLCEACTVYIGSTDDPVRLEALAKRFETDVEDVRCFGCRSDKVCSFCTGCKFVECAAGKGVNFCAECNDYPCGELKEFQKAKPHRLELWEDSEEIKSKGYREWMKSARAKYTCSQCNEINSAYDIVCRKCGKDPANKFVELHKNKILNHLKK